VTAMYSHSGQPALLLSAVWVSLSTLNLLFYICSDLIHSKPKGKKHLTAKTCARPFKINCILSATTATPRPTGNNCPPLCPRPNRNRRKLFYYFANNVLSFYCRCGLPNVLSCLSRARLGIGHYRKSVSCAAIIQGKAWTTAKRNFSLLGTPRAPGLQAHYKTGYIIIKLNIFNIDLVSYSDLILPLSLSLPRHRPDRHTILHCKTRAGTVIPRKLGTISRYLGVSSHRPDRVYSSERNKPRDFRKLLQGSNRQDLDLFLSPYYQHSFHQTKSKVIPTLVFDDWFPVIPTSSYFNSKKFNFQTHTKPRIEFSASFNKSSKNKIQNQPKNVNTQGINGKLNIHICTETANILFQILTLPDLHQIKSELLGPVSWLNLKARTIFSPLYNDVWIFPRTRNGSLTRSFVQRLQRAVTRRPRKDIKTRNIPKYENGGSSPKTQAKSQFHTYTMTKLELILHTLPIVYFPSRGNQRNLNSLLRAVAITESSLEKPFLKPTRRGGVYCRSIPVNSPLA
jgi:hypothetical protein